MNAALNRIAIDEQSQHRNQQGNREQCAEADELPAIQALKSRRKPLADRHLGFSANSRRIPRISAAMLATALLGSIASGSRSRPMRRFTAAGMFNSNNGPAA